MGLVAGLEEEKSGDQWMALHEQVIRDYKMGYRWGMGVGLRLGLQVGLEDGLMLFEHLKKCEGRMMRTIRSHSIRKNIGNATRGER